MIQINDLRIGNIICSSTSSEWGEIGIVMGISEGLILVRCNGVYKEYSLSEIYPITLSVSVLENIGFELIEKEYDLLKEDYYQLRGIKLVSVLGEKDQIYLGFLI